MLDIAMALRLKGIASADHIAETTGADPTVVADTLAQMVEAGHAQETPRGLRLMPEGRTWLDEQLAVEREGVDHDAIEAVYERFCEHNGEFKQLVTDWQVRDVDGTQELNDHTDADYDQAIFDRLGALDAAVEPVFADAVALAPRLARYPERFAAALAAIQAGDPSFLAAPLKDSYHTVWFELHEELILLCGRTRAQEAAEGRGA